MDDIERNDLSIRVAKDNIKYAERDMNALSNFMLVHGKDDESEKEMVRLYQLIEAETKKIAVLEEKNDKIRRVLKGEDPGLVYRRNTPMNTEKTKYTRSTSKYTANEVADDVYAFQQSLTLVDVPSGPMNLFAVIGLVMNLEPDSVRDSVYESLKAKPTLFDTVGSPLHILYHWSTITPPITVQESEYSSMFETNFKLKPEDTPSSLRTVNGMIDYIFYATNGIESLKEDRNQLDVFVISCIALTLNCTLVIMIESGNVFIMVPNKGTKTDYYIYMYYKPTYYRLCARNGVTAIPHEEFAADCRRYQFLRKGYKEAHKGLRQLTN
jgi:hypothetical protein